MMGRCTLQVHMTDLICCWSGMTISLLLSFWLLPSALLTFCGATSSQVDVANLVAAAGMIVGGLAADALIGPVMRTRRWLMLASGLAAMLLIHAPMPETAFLALPDAGIILALAMTPSMVAGYGFAI